MTQQVSRLELRTRMVPRNQNIVLIVAGAVMVAIAAAIIYSVVGSGGSKVGALITDDVRGQLVTQNVSCHKLDFSVPSLTKQQVYACDAKGVTLYNRPNGHIHDSAFTRCYVMAVNGQTVDISHALSVEAKIRHKTVPCR